MSCEIIAFERAHLGEAANLFALRHRANRETEVLLPSAYTEPRVARGLLEEELDRHPSGVAALRDGRLAGYLIGNLGFDFMEPLVSVNPQGLAIAPGEDAELIRAMYATAAVRWVRNGYFEHQFYVATADAEATGALFSLGFGLYGAYNRRDLSPLAGQAAEIEIRRLGPERLDDVEMLRNGLRRYNASSPIFHPLIWRTGDDLERALEAERRGMADERHAYFIAYEDARPVGLMIFTPPPDYPLTPDGAVYLHVAFVYEGARAGGIGTALVNRGLEWAREHDYSLCTLSYYAPNLLGARFWQGKGFLPLGYALERRIDERIGWANGASAP
jgi:GNAT superfamily N-acetyltransferase